MNQQRIGCLQHKPALGAEQLQAQQVVAPGQAVVDRREFKAAAPLAGDFTQVGAAQIRRQPAYGNAFQGRKRDFDAEAGNQFPAMSPEFHLQRVPIAVFCERTPQGAEFDARSRIGKKAGPEVMTAFGPPIESPLIVGYDLFGGSGGAQPPGVKPVHTAAQRPYRGHAMADQEDRLPGFGRG